MQREADAGERVGEPSKPLEVFVGLQPYVRDLSFATFDDPLRCWPPEVGGSVVGPSV